MELCRYSILVTPSISTSGVLASDFPLPLLFKLYGSSDYRLPFLSGPSHLVVHGAFASAL